MNSSSNKNNINIHDQEMELNLKERLTFFYKQESEYKSSNYLYLKETNYSSNQKERINEKCRYTMANWCFEALKSLSALEETGSTAISILDRFLSSEEGNFALNNKRWFQLATICSLQLSIKMQESRNNTLNLIDCLKQYLGNTFSMNEIIGMEKEILYALSWRLCPPTAYDFLELLLYLLPTASSSNLNRSIQKSLLRKLARKYIKYSILHYSFSLESFSSIAIASILNAMEEINYSHSLKSLFIQNCNSIGMHIIYNDCHILQKKLMESCDDDVNVKMVESKNKRTRKYINNVESDQISLQKKGRHSPVCIGEEDI